MTLQNSDCVFDIETTGIDCFATFAGLKRIHCIGVSVGGESRLYGPAEIEEGLEFLACQSTLVGHNIVNFDIPAIQYLYPEWKPRGAVRDTIIYSRLADPDRKTTDWAVPEGLGITPKLRGSHSLAAWGERLKFPKQDFKTDWADYTDEMGEYCLQDVAVTVRLWDYLKSLPIAEKAIEVEHEFAKIIQRQEQRGFVFDVAAASDLYSVLVQRKTELDRELQVIFPPSVVKMKTPQYWEDGEGNHYRVKSEAPAKIRKSLVRGPLKERETPFNPGSRSQIAQAFIDKYNWSPTEFTADGRPRVDEGILSGLDYAEAEPLGEYLMITKRLGQLAEGREAYLKLERDGRIHGQVNTYGTVTGRCSHNSPNTAQVPATRSPYGKEFRSLFTVPSGYSLVGCDASQLELRCLAHYMDDPDYVREIIDGDIHTRNQQAAGLPTRDAAKVFAYAVCYGAGAHKLGQIVEGNARIGSRLKRRFLSNIPALGNLIDKAQARSAKSGYVRGLLGQRLPVRSAHRALNTLLQGAGASIMKVATIRMHELFRERGWDSNDAAQVAHVHDEVQFQVRQGLEEDVGACLVQAIQDTTQLLKLRCPQDGDFHIGRTWAETH